MGLLMELITAIERQLESASIKQLSALAGQLSESYRSQKGNLLSKGRQDTDYIASYEQALAYAAFRMPATFAAVYFVLSQANERLHWFQPESLLDVGSGPGTAAWAAAAIWTNLKQVTLIEKDDNMMALGKKLALSSSQSCIRKAKWIKTDVLGQWDVPRHDVVVASYMLNELPGQSVERLALKLWDRTDYVLAFIEPGTPAGFSTIKRVREVLLKEGANIAAPCPHTNSCPLSGDDWCHFSQRLNRTRLHRQIKNAILPYEDEKFSFVCFSRVSVMEIKGIVIRHPQIRKGHIYLRLCTPGGIVNMTIAQRDKERFKEARKLEWGSIVMW